MTRSVMREHIFKILFRAEFYDTQEMAQQINYYLEEVPKVTEKEVNEITGKVLNIVDKIPEIDEMINSVSKSWPTSRLGKSELTIMRLAVYEIKFDEDIPTNVAINEAVELAKSSDFVKNNLSAEIYDAVFNNLNYTLTKYNLADDKIKFEDEFYFNSI